MSHVVLLAAVTAALAGAPAPADETPSEKIRKALDQPIDLEFNEGSMAAAVEHFHKKTGLDILIDRTPYGPIGFGMFDPLAPTAVRLGGKFKGVKARDALRKVFEPLGLTPFIVDDAVLLTTEDAGTQKQLRQRVDVDVDDRPLAAALKQLGRRKAMNIIVDQKAAKEAEKKVSLQVEDVPVEAAVRLLAEQAGMKTARIDNVLYVTTAERAASIAAENRANVPNYYNPYGIYGIAGGPGAIGAFGALGAVGLAGGGGVIGLGGGGGITGIIPGSVPVPLPVKPPPEKPELPPKPLSQAPQAGPAVAVALAPATRPELWARPAVRPTLGARRSRRRTPPSEPVLA